MTFVRGKGPCLPPFDENKDDLDANLRRWELFAQTERWLGYLSPHMKGVTLEVYAGLSEEEAMDH